MNLDYPTFIKYQKIPHLAENPSILDESVEVYEKLDGGNCQVRNYQGVILAGNRSKFLRDADSKFDWFNVFLNWAKSNNSFYNLSENLIVFGEWLAYHTITYSQEHIDKFYVIDVFDLDTKMFLPYQNAKKILSENEIAGVEFLPLLHFGKINLNNLEQLTENSSYKDGESEGVVVKDYQAQRFAKLWASTVNKTPLLTEENLKRVCLSIKNLGGDLSIASVVKEWHGDLHSSGKNIPLEHVRDYVIKNFDNV